MTMDFSASAGAVSNSDLLPKGQLAWANMNVRGLKQGGTGSQYLDCEFTIAEGQPFAGRKLWDKIGDPFFAGNSEKYRQMGMIAVTRILEAGRGAGPNNPDGYKLDNFTQLDGLKVAIKIGVEDGEGGHDDKNRVADFLTPNPNSQSGYKGFQKLLAGEYAPASKAAAAAPATGFGGQGTGGAAPATGGGFGQVATPAAQPPASGFGNAGQGGQPEAPAPFGNQTGQGAAAPETKSAADASPSDPGATPGWLEQSSGAPSA